MDKSKWPLNDIRVSYIPIISLRFETEIEKYEENLWVFSCNIYI